MAQRQAAPRAPTAKLGAEDIAELSAAHRAFDRVSPKSVARACWGDARSWPSAARMLAGKRIDVARIAQAQKEAARVRAARVASENANERHETVLFRCASCGLTQPRRAWAHDIDFFSRPYICACPCGVRVAPGDLGPILRAAHAITGTTGAPRAAFEAVEGPAPERVAPPKARARTTMGAEKDGTSG
jgi:hypothetical protein